MAGERSLSSDNPFDEEGNKLEDDAEAKTVLRPFLGKSSPPESCHGLDMPFLTRSDSRAGMWSPNLRDLHILSISFLFVFLAYSALQNLESSMNADLGLGSAALGLLYLSMTISSLGASMVVMWLGSKTALVLALSGYWAFTIANLYPSWYTLAPASVFLGFTASVLWVAEGTYLTIAAKRHAAACGMREATALGNFNGEFWGFFQSNQVVGNLLTLAFLQNGTEKDSSSGTTQILIFVFLGSLAVGTALICFLRPHTDTMILPPGSAVTTPVESNPALVKASFRLLSEKKTLLLIFPFFYTGMQQAFIWGDFTKHVITPSFGLSWVGGVMAAYGAADTFGSVISGKISSGLFSISTLLCGGAICQMLVIGALSVKDMYSTKEQLKFVVTFAAAVLWGLGDAVIHTQFSSLLGICYPNDVAAAFAQWRIWESAGTSAVFFASPYVNFDTKLWLLFSCLLLAMGFYFIAVGRSARAA